MKNILLIVVLLCTSVFAQLNYEKPFTDFHFGILGGVNVTSPMRMGYTALLELKTNVSARINIRASIGLSSIIENIDENIAGFTYYSSAASLPYRTCYFNADSYEYSVAPFSLGLEYLLFEGNAPVYILLEGGYNHYTITANTDQTRYTGEGYDSYEEMPDKFKNEYPRSSDETSYRIGIGAGTHIELTKGLNLELRYLYNINTSLINCHQFLIGISL